MTERSKVQNDVEQVALMLSSASAALQNGRYNQLNGLLHGALESLATASRGVRELEEELARTRALLAAETVAS